MVGEGENGEADGWIRMGLMAGGFSIRMTVPIVLVSVFPTEPTHIEVLCFFHRTEIGKCP